MIPYGYKRRRGLRGRGSGNETDKRTGTAHPVKARERRRGADDAADDPREPMGNPQHEYAKSIGFPDLPQGDPDLCGDGTYHDWELYDAGPDDCTAQHPRGVPCHFGRGHAERGQSRHWNGLVGTW